MSDLRGCLARLIRLHWDLLWICHFGFVRGWGTLLLSAPHSPRFCSVGRRFLGRCFLGRRFLDTLGNRTDDAVATRRSHTWGKSYFLRNFVYISWFNWNVFSLCVQLQLVNLVAFQRRDKSIPRKPPLYLPTTRDFLETCKCKLIFLSFLKKKNNNNKNSLKGSLYAFWFVIFLFIHKWYQEKEPSTVKIPSKIPSCTFSKTLQITDRLMISSEHF